jgi:hypothetical protein
MTVQQRERPILFSAPMIRAILDGRKTQTRRVVKPQPVDEDEAGWYIQVPTADRRAPGLVFNDRKYIKCPYGQSGDRLWVRETWAHSDGLFCGPYYKATARDFDQTSLHWRPSIHMPRWASRINLEIADVRVERLWDISEADVQAEGCTWLAYRGGERNIKYKREPEQIPDDPSEFSDLWDTWYRKTPYAWHFNPWVWSLEFKQL